MLSGHSGSQTSTKVLFPGKRTNVLMTAVSSNSKSRKTWREGFLVVVLKTA